MRKFVVAGVIATLAVALLAIPASASFDHHFSVISKQVSSHNEPNRFRFEDKLFNPRNRSNRVGRLWGECKVRRGVRKLKCHALVHLNGEIGGFGNIRVRGHIGRHDNRVEVVAGNRDFNGVAGKMLIHNLHGSTDKLHFDLVH